MYKRLPNTSINFYVQFCIVMSKLRLCSIKHPHQHQFIRGLKNSVFQTEKISVENVQKTSFWNVSEKTQSDL